MDPHEEHYAVYFEPIGYYAENQGYEWKFTHLIEKAKLYKTKEAALERLNEGIKMARSLSSGTTLIGETHKAMSKVTSGDISYVEVSIEESYRNDHIDVIEKPRFKIDKRLMKVVNDRIDMAVKKGEYSTSLHSLSDCGNGVRGIDMYLSPNVYAELCRILKEDMGLGIKVEKVGDRLYHKVFWSKFNLQNYQAPSNLKVGS